MTTAPGPAPAPTVSIIMPAYNTAPYIGAAVASVMAQTYTSYELIVINDGSPDTPEIERVLEPFMDRLVYVKQENRGLSTARNHGILAARGRYIALLDSDDEWEPEYLAFQVAALEADPSIDVLYPDARIFGDHPHAGSRYMQVCPSRGKVTFESLLTGRCNVFVSVLARREAILRAGLFDTELRSVEDFDLWLRVLATGGRIDYHRKVLVRFRKRRGSLSSDPVWMAEHAIAVLEKAERTLDLSPADLAVLQRQQGFFRASRDLALGKRAFFRLEFDRAVEHFRDANVYFRSPKLWLVGLVMRRAPGLLLRMYGWRDRVLLGTDTRF
jgi:glycosyltransferase involved in cell wall biosynthesis